MRLFRTRSSHLFSLSIRGWEIQRIKSISVTDRPAPQTQLNPPRGTERPSRSAEPRGELGGRPWQEPRPGRGAAGAQGARGAPQAERKLLFRAGLPRGALPPPLSEPLISAPALVSTLPFLGGDFTRSDLTHRCRFMLRLMAGNPMAPHSSILAWKIPWTKEPGRLQSMDREESDRTEAT